MALRVAPPVGKVLYAALFNVVLPLLLVLWARATEKLVTVPVPPFPALGFALVVTGATLMLWATYALKRHGGGLPMNVYPPPRFVTTGPYAIVSHPIYAGATLVSAGISIVTTSRSGLWLITPVLALACVALVWGYEKHDLDERFGHVRTRPWLSLVPDGQNPPSPSQRLGVLFSVVVMWIAAYETVALIGVPRHAIELALPFERSWPVLEWSEVVYASVYFVVAASPFIAPTGSALRRFQVRGYLAMAIVFPLFVFLPIVATPRPFSPTSTFGELLQIERAIDTAAGAFPSFHVVWAFIAASVVAMRWPRVRSFAWFWAVAVSLSCITTGMHPIADVAAGFLVAAAVLRMDLVWRVLRDGTERIASSWRDWHIGPVRIINHGAYAGIGTFLAVLIVQWLLGGTYVLEVSLVALCGLVVAALWAQVIEGSHALMRPYGFYGGVLGILVGSLLCDAAGRDGWSILAAYAVSAPYVQAWGRLRCLVQGCCHGAPAPVSVGIRYHHAMSRVCRLSNLKDVPVHPTPLYSILWNIPIALVIGRLWALEVPSPFICGVYLVLTGLGRFVEEAYRGEPQTPIHAGLRLYQWVAIATVLLGAVFTSIPGIVWIAEPAVTSAGLVSAIAAGLVTGLALGLDFPSSDKRFSRLA